MAISTPGRGPLGRPTLCDTHTQELIFQFLADGNYLVTACQAAGISYETYANWRERASKGEEPYFSFMQEMKKAAAVDEAFRVARIKKHGETNLIADLAHLGRRYRDRWSENRPDMEQHSITRIEVVVTFRPPPIAVEGSDALPGIVEGEVRAFDFTQAEKLGPGESPEN